MTTTTERTLVNYTTTDGIAIIELTNAPANTYSNEMMRQLDDAILQARIDENVHVLLLRGAGEKFFSAGAEISMLNAVTPTFKYYFCLHANETLTRLEQTPKLVIAALNGHTVGGGLEIAQACDMRIARRGGGKVGLPEVSLGVLPGTGGTQRMARALPKNKAIELMTEGKLISFEERSISASSTTSTSRRTTGTRSCSTRSRSARPTKPPKPWGASNAPCSRARKSPSPKPWPSSANCNNCSSRARTPKRASPPILRSAKLNSSRRKC